MFVPDYSSVQIHKLMLGDDVRVRAYLEALEKAEPNGKTVIEVGAGSGVLAVAAAKMGARRVVAIEECSISSLAKELVAKNRVSEVVEIYEKNSFDVTLEEPGDILVSEFMGVGFFEENMLPAFLDARDRLARSGATLIPYEIDLVVAPVSAEAAWANEVGCWATEEWGIDLSPIATAAGNEYYLKRFHSEELLAQPACVSRLDLRSEEPTSRKDFEAAFVIESAGVLHGWSLWFEARLQPGITLDTGPLARPTHWRQVFFPFEKAVSVEQGEKVRGTFNVGLGQRSATWSWSWATNRDRGSGTAKQYPHLGEILLAQTT